MLPSVADTTRKGHDVTVLDNFSTGLPENLYHLGNQIKTVKCDLGFEGEWQGSFKEIDPTNEWKHIC